MVATRRASDVIGGAVRAGAEDRAVGGITRRRFLALASVSLLAGCAVSRQSASMPTSTPAGALQVIGRENAGRMSTVAIFGRPGDGAAQGVAWSPDGSALAVSISQKVQIWNVSAHTPEMTLPGPTSLVQSLAWSADGSLLAADSDDGAIYLWTMPMGTAGATLASAHADPLSLAWSPDNRHLVAGDNDGAVRVWDVRSGRISATWTGPEQRPGANQRHPVAVYGVDWSPDGRRIASTRYDGIVQVWDAATGKSLATVVTDDYPNGVAWSPDGKTLASSSDKGTIQFWDTTSYRNVRTLDGHDAAGWAYPLAWSADGRMIACGYASGLAHVWDAQAGVILNALQGHTLGVWAVAWSPDGRLLATASDDGTVRLWGVR